MFERGRGVKLWVVDRGGGVIVVCGGGGRALLKCVYESGRGNGVTA